MVKWYKNREFFHSYKLELDYITAFKQFCARFNCVYDDIGDDAMYCSEEDLTVIMLVHPKAVHHIGPQMINKHIIAVL